MILIPCTIPERAVFDQALKRRIVSTHQKRPEIESDYQKRMTGYRGEKSLDYYLEKLPEDKFDIIHGLRLPCTVGDTFFQMDVLVLTILMILIIEVKNWMGNLHFDKNLNQMIRTFPDSGITKREPNPVLQAREQASQLKKWLIEHNLGNIPVEYLFVNSNNKSIITVDPESKHILQRVCTSETLIDKIQQITPNQKQTNMRKPNLKKVEEALLSANTPQKLDIQEIYKISGNEILPGVHCPKCFAISMVYKSGTWHCPQCSYKSKTAPIYTLNDYFLLMNPTTITNSQFRHFFQIPSPFTANRIIKSLNLPSTGNNKGRIYYKPEKNFPLDE